MSALPIHEPFHRQASLVVADFAAAADRLAKMAGDWRQGQFCAGDIADADATCEGMHRLLVELRAPDMGGDES